MVIARLAIECSLKDSRVFYGPEIEQGRLKEYRLAFYIRTQWSIIRLGNSPTNNTTIVPRHGYMWERY